MDKQGFRNMLQGQKLPKGKIEAAVALAERFEAFLTGKPTTAENAWAFSKILIAEGNNTRENYVALIRYCRFIKNDEMFTALMELVDGGDVSENLYRLVGEKFGGEVRDDIFAGIGVAPYGIPSPDKPAYMHPVIERLQAKVGEQASRDFLSACLRDLPDKYFLGEKRKYRKAKDIDEYLKKRHQGFVRWLRSCQRQGQLFFVQEITDEVLAFVKSDQEIGGGRREGNIIFETKVPYLTKQYLAEKDPTMKRYYACHCPWAREAVRRGDTQLVEDFCYCSAGFHKKPFEVAFGQPLKTEVLESVLRGDDRCRFAIYLPEEAITGK
jgi:hypothetical protein